MDDPTEILREAGVECPEGEDYFVVRDILALACLVAERDRMLRLAWDEDHPESEANTFDDWLADLRKRVKP